MQLALVMETRNMAVTGQGIEKAVGRAARKGYDALKPYRSGFDRSRWDLRHGSNRCVCQACNDGFKSVSSFDRHQVINSNGDVICRDPATLGMVRNDDGWWVNSLYEREEQAS